MVEKPAIEGGSPIRETFLPYGTQWIDEAEINEVIEVLKSNWITTGPKMRLFEENFKEFRGSKHAVAVNSGTAALHVAASSIEINPGDEVITTPLTFVASANCVVYRGGTPVLADINKESYNIDPKEIRKKITPKTKAIIPVHFTGQPCEMDEILEIAEDHDLKIIEDAAHAIDAEYKGKKIGNISDMTIFSFHPVKNITTAEGGMVTTNDDDLYERLLMYRTHGITRDAEKRFGKSGGYEYDMQYLGYRYNLSELHAALGIHQLKKLDSFQRRRREIVKIYDRELQSINEITIPYRIPDIKHSWHLYVIQIDTQNLKVDRDHIFNALREENIGVNVHYIPVHYHSFYQKNFGYKIGMLPNVEWLFPRILSIPIFPKMNDEDVYDVINAIEKIITYYRK
ncbi:MAG: UDP-4-amino-4,6-dideoxy-N-acetyl-beta-L-altrosamine transaminase [Candidatus Lokiarchaeota archaeon]|nr:UDP-4-amino-4,6-dideoxy-N-acetyl-beta-L-altrosamine transaminase [Candidatus Lokiarchaeota archaeon]